MGVAQTNQLVLEIKQFDVDFEWYPTTQLIMSSIKEKIQPNDSVLDVGAGDGRVLAELTEGNKYAIEKSKPLIAAMPSDVFIIGTEFDEQTLLDKRVDVVFSNPPYSKFETWAERIIREAQAYKVFLVIPERWKNSVLIKDAIKDRKATSEVILSTDFLDADRQARAKVDVIEITLGMKSSYGREPSLRVDPFSLWFEQNFPLTSKEEEREPLKTEVENALVEGSDMVTMLEQLYQRDFNRLLDAYQSVSRVDASILDELDVDKESLRAGLKQKSETLKDKYWRILFEHLDKVTLRLTSNSRSELFNVLTKNTHVDFTAGNVYAVLEWVIKNANQYFDEQLISTYERMIEKANVVNYVSNQRTFRDDEWRYYSRPNDLSHYKLELRVVLERVGGLETDFSWREYELRERAGIFLNDLCTIAYNLGFDTSDMERAKDFKWQSGTKCVFHYRNHDKDSIEPLMEVKAFKNGNLHIKFNKKLMCKLNVEFGRLKGWLRSKEQAASELNIPKQDVAVSFNSNMQLTSTTNIFCLEVKK
jgi:Domain of unknown function (DUF4942)